MSKLLIALLALDIGVSLSKVFIFTWKFLYDCLIIELIHFSKYFSALKTGTIILKKYFWFFL